VSTFGDALRNNEPDAPPKDIAQPDEALIIRLSAQKLWSEGQSSSLIEKLQSDSNYAKSSASVRRP